MSWGLGVQVTERTCHEFWPPGPCVLTEKTNRKILNAAEPSSLCLFEFTDDRVEGRQGQETVGLSRAFWRCSRLLASSLSSLIKDKLQMWETVSTFSASKNKRLIWLKTTKKVRRPHILPYVNVFTWCDGHEDCTQSWAEENGEDCCCCCWRQAEQKDICSPSSHTSVWAESFLLIWGRSSRSFCGNHVWIWILKRTNLPHTFSPAWTCSALTPHLSSPFKWCVCV